MPRKLGQHFLASTAFLDRIARLICISKQPKIVEIGPGRGALTARLIECASHVTAVEIDAELVAFLRSRFSNASNLNIIHADALQIDFAAYTPDTVAGNLPYYIATQLIERTVCAGLRGVYLIQKEVAQRLIAQPGTRDYGYLTVRTRLYADAELMFLVPPGAFNPPPKVDSAVVALTPHNRATELGINDTGSFMRFLGACFRQKRKMLRSNLRGEFPIAGHAEGQLRAEQLSLDALADLWKRMRI